MKKLVKELLKLEARLPMAAVVKEMIMKTAAAIEAEWVAAATRAEDNLATKTKNRLSGRFLVFAKARKKW